MTVRIMMKYDSQRRRILIHSDGFLQQKQQRRIISNLCRFTFRAVKRSHISVSFNGRDMPAYTKEICKLEFNPAASRFSVETDGLAIPRSIFEISD